MIQVISASSLSFQSTLMFTSLNTVISLLMLQLQIEPARTYTQMMSSFEGLSYQAGCRVFFSKSYFLTLPSEHPRISLRFDSLPPRVSLCCWLFSQE